MPHKTDALSKMQKLNLTIKPMRLSMINKKNYLYNQRDIKLIQSTFKSIILIMTYFLSSNKNN